MKRLGIVLFGVLCVILSYAFSHASEINCKIIHCEKIEQGNGVKIAWDEVTKLINGKSIDKSEFIGYFVYISIVNKDEDINDKKCELQNEKPINKDPIKDTRYETHFPKPGQYIVGVEAALYEDKLMQGEPKKSMISCSYSKACTNNNPFVLKVVKSNN